jgi:uncharacterized protein YwqG
VIEELGSARSRAGGHPDLPKDVEWPTYGDDVPMCFLAQIECSELAAVDVRGELPHDGTLVFFLRPDDIVVPRPRRSEYASYIPSRVMWFERGCEVAPRTAPIANMPTNPVYPATALRLRTAWTFPNDQAFLALRGYGEATYDLEEDLPWDRMLGYGAGTFDGPAMPPTGSTLLLAIRLGWQNYMDWEGFAVAFFCITDTALRDRAFDKVIVYPSTE